MKEIRQYRKKPVVVEAVQLNTTNMPEVADWIGYDTAKIVVESEEAWKLGKHFGRKRQIQLQVVV